MTYDLVVIGGGPGGCSAAITAVRTGATVLLLERGTFPRNKVCGEFVSAESLELLHNLLAPAYQRLISEAPKIARGRIFSDGAELGAEINPPAASITRFDLDSALWRSCILSGVEAREQCTAQTVEGTGPFRVTAGGEYFETKALVNAAGRWSNLTGSQKVARPRKEQWIGIKAHYMEPVTPASVDLYFFDGGYCGIQPVRFAQNGSAVRINVCAMVRADVATRLPEVLRCHPTLQERSRSWQPLMDTVSTSPLVFHPPKPAQAGMLQVGDSATFVDPFIGDGISLALRSGALAAECLARSFRNPGSQQDALAEYSRLYKQRLAGVFRASAKLRNLLRWPAAVRRPVLLLLERTPFLTNQLVKMTR